MASICPEDDLDAVVDSDDEHFEDFTTATDWESFIADLEKILSKWQSIGIGEANVVNNWVVVHEKVLFAGWPFAFSYYRKQDDSTLNTTLTHLKSGDCSEMPSEQNLPVYLTSSIRSGCSEFPPKPTPHVLAEYYNLQEFAVLSSAAQKPIENESKLKMLLSSACIAINNTSTNFPIHIQYHHWSQNYFCGIAESCTVRTDFQIIHLRHLPKQYWYLSGLLEIFKSKIGSSLSSPIELSVHFFYTMKEWHPNYTYETELLDIVDSLRKSLTLKDSEDCSPGWDSANHWRDFQGFLQFLPFGPKDEPFENLIFIAGWPQLNEDVVVDSPTYSDLEPRYASECYFSLNPSNQVDFRLEEFLRIFWKMRRETRTVEEILGKKLDFDNNDDQYMSALDRIASGNSLLPKPVVQLNRVITNVNRQVHKQLLYSPSQYLDLAPLPQADLDVILGYLFPDSLCRPRYPYPSTFGSPHLTKENLKVHLDALQGMKTVPIGSLIWRFGVIISYVITVSSSSGAIAHLWAELILELRYRFENSVMIIGSLDSSTQLYTGNQSSIAGSRYKLGMPVILLIHGFKNNHTSGFSKTLIKAYLTSTEFTANVIAVYWKGANPSFANLNSDVFYIQAVNNIPPAAKLIMQFLKFLIQEKAILGPEQIHIVGFSLGAHVAGVAGHFFYNETGSKIRRITGLDPAGPLFHFKDRSNKLDKSDATFVDVVHTNKGMKGTDELGGHVDFFPNGGGPIQPGCTSMTDFTDIFTGSCSHAAAYKYFARSVFDKTMTACKCRSDEVIQFERNCDTAKCLEPVTFGQHCPPTLEDELPNTGTCLLNQKLQMLNACIQKRVAREAQERSKPEEEVPEEEGSEEEEFFDCDEALNIDDIKKLHKPVGRLKKCGRLRLLKTGEPLYIPITQDPAPLTEDVVEEHLQMMVNLGDDAEGSELRAKMMSASLASDMQAFKAANPGAVLDDFVRWHSPRDWVESEELDEFGNKEGMLSPRMEAPGNLWQDVWSSTQPVPCRRQKRLFDDTKEAEKVLKWMTSRTLKEIVELLFPCLAHISLLKTLDEIDKLPVDYEFPISTVQDLAQLTRTSTSEVLIDEAYTKILSSVATAERDISQLYSFAQKFPGINLKDVLTPEEERKMQKFPITKYIKIEGGLSSEVGKIIKDVFCKELAINQLVEAETEFTLSKPTKRVFILKYMPQAKASSSDRTIPHRMSCCLRNEEFLAALTYSTRTEF